MNSPPADSAKRSGSTTRLRARLRNARASLVLCGPAVALYAGFMILPAILGFAYSLTDWNGWGKAAHYVGLANYHELFGNLTSYVWAWLKDLVLLHWSAMGKLNFTGDERFWSAVGFTLFETAMIVVFFTFGSLLLAVLLDRLRHMKGLIRGLFFYPYILSLLVSSMLFVYLADFHHGLVNILLQKMGLGSWTQEWMMGPNLAPFFIFALVAWSALGFFTTLYLANLQTIPTELYEAASLDGAGPVSVFTRIQLPMLMPTVTTNSVLALIFGVNLFGQIVVTTQGGPGYNTVTIGYYIYMLSLNRQGYASTVSFVTLVALVAVAIVQVSLLRRRQVEL